MHSGKCLSNISVKNVITYVSGKGVFTFLQINEHSIAV